MRGIGKRMTRDAGEHDRLGPYLLLNKLGEGGMGSVYLARAPGGRQVAVKILPAAVADDEHARTRLARTMSTVRRLHSPYIADVVDFDMKGHRPYIATRYVPGQPLDKLVERDGPLDLPGLIRLAHGMAEALVAAHTVGVIHRDLNPANVLILDGEPVLTGFGIAQAYDATRMAQAGGMPSYLAPEIIEGREAGPAADVHAWAGVLLYAATGRPPFGGGTIETIVRNILAGTADVDAAPAPLRPLLKAAFHRDPGERPMAGELAEQTASMLTEEWPADTYPQVSVERIQAPPAYRTTYIQDLPPPSPLSGEHEYSENPSVSLARAGHVTAPASRSPRWRAFVDGLTRVLMPYPLPRRAPGGQRAAERVIARLDAAYTALGDPPPALRPEPGRNRP